jgi:hypothetical protein
MNQNIPKNPMYLDDLENNIITSNNLLSNDQINYIYKVGNTVHFLSIIDLIFSFIFLFFGHIGYYILFKTLCASSGYYGSKYYNYNIILLYWVNLFINSISEIIILYYYYYLFSKKNINEQQIICLTFIQIILILTKCYIAKFVYMFMNLIKNLNDIDRTRLINYNKQNIQIIYW